MGSDAFAAGVVAYITAVKCRSGSVPATSTASTSHDSRSARGWWFLSIHGPVIA